MKVWVALLFALIIVSVISGASTVQSQQFSTVTMTLLTTSTQPTTMPVSTETLTTGQGQSTSIVSAPVTLPGTHGGCGVYFNQTFTAPAGTTLTGTFTASSKVNFYIMTQSVFHSWSLQTANCLPTNLLLNQQGATSYNFTTTIPTTGSYQIVINNLSETTITAQLNASLSTTAPILITTTLYTTSMQEMVQTMMQNSTSTIPSTSGSTDYTLPAAIGIVIIIIIAAILIMKSRRRSTQK